MSEGEKRAYRPAQREKWSGAQVSELLVGLGLTPVEFGVVMGVSQTKVQRWLEEGWLVPVMKARWFRSMRAVSVQPHLVVVTFDRSVQRGLKGVGTGRGIGGPVQGGYWAGWKPSGRPKQRKRKPVTEATRRAWQQAQRKAWARRKGYLGPDGEVLPKAAQAKPKVPDRVDGRSKNGGWLNDYWAERHAREAHAADAAGTDGGHPGPAGSDAPTDGSDGRTVGGLHAPEDNG